MLTEISSSVKRPRLMYSAIFFFTATATTEIYTLSLHDALPILRMPAIGAPSRAHLRKVYSIAAILAGVAGALLAQRSEEHTSELQSRFDLVCRLLLEKKKKR